MLDKQAIVIVPTRPNCKWKKDERGRDVPEYIHGKYHYTLEDALQYVSENRGKWILPYILLYNTELRDAIREIGVEPFLKEIQSIRPDDYVFQEYIDELQEEWHDLKVADYDISIVAICDDVQILGETFHGLSDIQNKVEKSKLNTYSIDTFPHAVSYPHVGKVYESYPCFDSYDSMYENRKYQTFIFRRNRITDCDIIETYDLEYLGNFRRIHENIPVDMLPMIYYKGEGGYMLVGTERQKSKEKNATTNVIRPLKSYYFFYEESIDSVEIVDVKTHLEDKKNYLEVNEYNGRLTLPESINGKYVTKIKDFILMATDRVITSKELIVPPSYRCLGKKNFSGWNAVERILLYCQANALSEWNFAYCNNLKSVICMNYGMYLACERPGDRAYCNAYGLFDGCQRHIKIIRG